VRRQSGAATPLWIVLRRFKKRTPEILKRKIQSAVDAALCRRTPNMKS